MKKSNIGLRVKTDAETINNVSVSNTNESLKDVKKIFPSFLRSTYEQQKKTDFKLKRMQKLYNGNL